MRTSLSVTLSALAALLLVLSVDPARARAAASGSAERSAVLVMVVEQQTKKSPTDSDMTVEPLPEVRNDLASYIRDTFGHGLAPSLSREESQCVDLSCQRKLAEAYQAGYVLNIAIRRNFEPGVACTITLIGIGLTSGTEHTTAKKSEALTEGCSREQLQQGLRRLAEDVLHGQLGIPYAPPPARPMCRSPYLTRLRGVGLGIGGGLALAGLGWGAGAAAQPEVFEYTPREPQYQARFANRSAHIGGGFGTMAAGLAIGGAAMLPFERWVRGSDPVDCVPPPEGKWGFRRSALAGFFATSLAASLLSTALLGAYASGQPCGEITESGTSRSVSCSIPSLWGAGLGLSGVHALGLILTIAVP